MLLTIGGCCNPTPDVAKEKEAILQIEKAQRDYHFKKDAAAFIQLFSDSFISINKGSITKPSKKESLERFDRYFKSVEFVRWDDIQEPVVRFSKDASIAWVTVQKEVITKQPSENNIPVFDTTHFSWVSIYKKEQDKWKIDCVVSTSKQ